MKGLNHMVKSLEKFVLLCEEIGELFYNVKEEDKSHLCNRIKAFFSLLDTIKEDSKNYNEYVFPVEALECLDNGRDPNTIIKDLKNMLKEAEKTMENKKNHLEDFQQLIRKNMNA